MTPSSSWVDKLCIGASGYHYDDWVGSFYPRGLPKNRYLAYYATRFPAVEINVTYYRIPPPKTFSAMAARTPEHFKFVVKANQDMTHARSRELSLYRSFRESILPLEDAGKLDGVLLQFPFGFRNEPANRSHLAFLRQALPGIRLWAEFRHEGWARPPVQTFLKDLSVGYCAVDEPVLDGLMPPQAYAVGDIGYVRFHGRNAATWWGGGHERYDWDYTADELGEWEDRLHSLAETTQRTYVFFNNCYMGRAVKSAALLRRLLGLSDDLNPQTELDW